MEKLIARTSRKSIGLLIVLILSVNVCTAQSERQQVFQEVYRHYPEASLPITDIPSLKTQDTINARLLNRLLFDLQDGRAQHYVRDTLYKIPSYGRISERPFRYSDSKQENDEWIDFEVSFPINAYPLARIDFGEDHVGLITRVVGFMTDYADIYLFEKSTGTLKSLINAFEAPLARHGHPESGYEAIYNNTSIAEDKQIKWHQVRYGVTTDRTFDVSPDGYFRVIYQKSEGEPEF